MTENDINAKISQALSTLGPDYWYCKTSDRSTGGQPDFMLLGHGRYSGWEVKYADPDFKLPSLQLLTCRRIDRVAYCRFVIFRESTNEIEIVHPNEMNRDKTYLVWTAFEEHNGKFDYEGLVQFMKEVHTQ